MIAVAALLAEPDAVLVDVPVDVEEAVLDAVAIEVVVLVVVDVTVDVEEPVLDAVLLEDEVAVVVVEGAQAIAATGASRFVVVPSPICPCAL